MLVFTITISALMAVALTAQQLRIDYFKSKSIRYRKRINTLKTVADEQQDKIKRLNDLLTQAYKQDQEKANFINYIDNFMRNETKYIEVIEKLKGGEHE